MINLQCTSIESDSIEKEIERNGWKERRFHFFVVQLAINVKFVRASKRVNEKLIQKLRDRCFIDTKRETGERAGGRKLLGRRRRSLRGFGIDVSVDREENSAENSKVPKSEVEKFHWMEATFPWRELCLALSFIDSKLLLISLSLRADNSAQFTWDANLEKFDSSRPIIFPFLNSTPRWKYSVNRETVPSSTFTFCHRNLIERYWSLTTMQR